MKKRYYKTRSLIVGILLFGVSMFFLGMLVTISVKDGIYDMKDTWYAISFIASLITMIIGEGFILDAASYDAPQENHDE